MLGGLQRGDSMICPYCGKDFAPPRSTSKVCKDAECRRQHDNAINTIAYYRRRAVQWPQTRPCAECKAPFASTRSSHIYCGWDCYYTHMMTYQRDRQQQQRGEPYSASRACVGCGKIILVKGSAWRRISCSRSCRHRARSASC